MQAGRYFTHSNERQYSIHICSASNRSKQTSCLLFVSKVSSLALLLSFSELRLLVPKPFKQLVMIDVVRAEEKTKQENPG